MSNDTPPRACLSGFGFIAAVLDPKQKLSCSAQVSGGTITFMSPELLVPEMYGMKGPKASPQADIYAFGMVIYQVYQQNCRVSAILIYTSPRSLRVKFHSLRFKIQLWDIMYFVGSARTNQRTPQPSGFLTRCGASPNAAGMVR